MSYIGLLNEISTSTYTNVSATDDLTVGSSLRNLGTLTQIGPATFSGTLTGLLTAVANGADLTYTYDASSKTFTIQINNASISNSKLANSSITLNGQSMSLGTSNFIPNTTITPAMLTNGTAPNQVLLTGVTPFAPTYQTLNTSYITENTNQYYTSARAIADAKTAISVTDSTEIDFTYTAGNITGVLRDNSVDISRIKTSQLSNYSLANTIVQRDATGSFSVNALSASSVSSNLLILNYNGVSGTYLKSTANYSLSPLAPANNLYIDTDNSGTLYINQNVTNTAVNVSGTTTMSGTLTASQGINIPTGQTYKINNVEYLASKTTDNLTQGTTNKYYSSTLAIADAKTAISATDSTEIDFTYTGGNITASLKDNSVPLSRLVSGSVGQVLIASLGGPPVYASLTLNNLPSGSTNQFLQTNGSTNSWTTMSGDASLSGGILSLNSGNLNTRIQTYLSSGTLSIPMGTYSTALSFQNPSATFGTSSTKQGVLELMNSSTSTTSITASITGSVLDVTAVASGIVSLGMLITGTGMSPTYITSYGTGSGNIGTYNLDASQTRTSTTMTGTINNASLISCDSTKNLFIDTADNGVLNLQTYNANSSIKVGCQSTLSRNLTLQPLAPTGAPADLYIRTSTGTATTSIIGATGAISCGNITATIGTSNIITPSSSTASLVVGTNASNNGVIRLNSSVNTEGSAIQQNNGNLYVDNFTTSQAINIGTITANQTINIGNDTSPLNLTSRPTFNSGSFNSIVRSNRYNNFYMAPFSCTSTIWYPVREGASGGQNLVLSYTGVIGQVVEFKVRISAAYNSSTGGYMYFDIHKATAQVAAQTSSTATSIVTNAAATTNGWGCHIIGPNVFQGVHFTATYTFTANETQLFYVVFRTATTGSCTIGSNTAGLNPYAEFQCQTLF